VLWLVVHDQERRSDGIVGVYDQLVVVEAATLLSEDRIKAVGRCNESRVVLHQLASFADYDLVQQDGLEMRFAVVVRVVIGSAASGQDQSSVDEARGYSLG
jgi:hypothetical protein